ncbi:MAG: AAA family ATPase [Gammaproteobacteria bacterium]|nr:AAA family ATPase [Gammaproteobacteria bacterium]MBU1601144.1 AAA family ATPase [Gammaproteobacteria bacterium]MBU2434503.1 AAA family ATPase [Gammaproteobacteria bacterium]MBU2450907.1 AAA family ATPase [Gammaproteobacteria bacterium]
MSLYLEHFGLREPPFRITPHTDFFFTGANRGPTLDALIYAITQDEGIVKVTGEVGSGKTMLCRMLLERLPENVETLYLANPSLSRQEILGAIADELGIPTDGKATHSLTRALQDALITRYGQGKRVVLLIDEAHAMPAESLEEIRLLSNLESKATKLLQIALFAQPELDDRLAATDMRQLRERITQHFNLTPLKQDDVAAYIEFRLRAAGYRGPNPFTAEAVTTIAKVSEGLSRRINIVADKALLAAYSSGTHQVGGAEIKLAALDARFSPLQPKTPFNLKPLIWGAGGAGIGSLLIALTIAAQSRPLPSPATPSKTSQTALAQPFPPSEPVKQTQPASLRPDTQSPAAALDKIRFATMTRQHFGQYEQWIETVPSSHYFIQLLATDAFHTGEIESFLARATEALEPSQIRAYRSSLSGRDRVGVIYGDFASRKEAIEAMQILPESIKAAQPFPRQVSKLR